MNTQIIEQVEFFSEAELESLEFVPEELEAIEAERVPNLDTICFEDIAKDLEAYFEQIEFSPTLTLEARSSVIIHDRVSFADISALKRNSSAFQVYFDASHPQRGRGSKPPHFDVNVTLSSKNLKDLGRTSSQTFSKFRFGTQMVNTTNQIKFEVRKFSPDIISMATNAQAIRQAIQSLNAGKPPDMVEVRYP